MESETILAMIAAFAIIGSAVTMATAWRINEGWSKFTAQQNKEWAEFYLKITEEQVDGNGKRDDA